MSYKYTSLEPGGQVIVTDEPREDLDELARWVRSDVDPETDPGVVPSGQQPVAGPVNTDAVSGGNPPLLSTTAGIADPAKTLSTEDAAAQAAKDLEGGVPPLQEQPPHTPDSAGSDDPGDGSAPANPLPGLNGSTEQWVDYAKSQGVEFPDDAGRDAIVAAYLEQKAPAGNASTADWAKWAADHGVSITDGDGRDKIRAAVVEAGWAQA